MRFSAAAPFPSACSTLDARSYRLAYAIAIYGAESSPTVTRPQGHKTAIVQSYRALYFLPLALRRNPTQPNQLAMLPEPRSIRQRQPPAPSAFGDALQGPLTL